jgi:hypothetical protein
LAGRYRLLVREGPRVSRERFDDLGAALDAIQARGLELERSAARAPVKSLLGRDYTPVQVVHGRIELRGPGVRAGVDVRGDSSAEAFTGRIRRALVVQRGGESAYAALRRELLP